MLTDRECQKLLDELDVITPMSQAEIDAIETNYQPVPYDEQMEVQHRIWFEGYRAGYMTAKHSRNAI